MKFKAYQLIERAIEEGVNYGYSRAHKHTDTPTEALLKGEIIQAITNELCEIIDFEDRSTYLHEDISVL
jgi:hypothetical protein